MYYWNGGRNDVDILKMPGQRGPTLTKWGVLESSIVDIGNCRNALAIRNSAGKKIALSGQASDTEILDYLKTFSTNTTMDRKLLCAKLGLPESATDAEINAKLTAIKADSENLLSVNTNMRTLKTELEAAKLKLAEKETAENLKKVTDLVEGAITDKKLLAGDKETYTKLATADYDSTKKLIDAMKPNASIESQMGNGSKLNAGNEAELQELIKLSGRELYMQGKFERLKVISVEYYKLKFKEYFGKEPQE